MSELAAAAMSYAGIGYRVFPLTPREKTPATRNGFKSATDDPNQIEWWWTQNKDYNVGIATGGLADVIDIDGDTGLASLARVAAGYKHQGPVTTTGRGYHLWIAVTGRSNFSHAKGVPSPYQCIDFRGKGGYVVAPPSPHPEGGVYSWTKPLSLPLPDAPDWLFGMFPQPSAPRQTSENVMASALGSLDLVEELRDIGAVLRPYGSNKLRGLCPFHTDTSPSFVVYLATDSFFCHGCRAWGDALNVRRFKMTGELH